ncbi:MAG: methylated-DNA--[protein]-cysteine S-methyltransferase [candidate division WOR-3 bacterium]
MIYSERILSPVLRGGISNRSAARLEFGWIMVWQTDGMIRRVALTSSFSGRSDPELKRVVEMVWQRGLKGMNLKFDFSGLSDFACRVLNLCAEIGFGQVRTYSELAGAAGVPGGARAVGQVMAHNPFCIFFPCHRVIAADGRLGGFTGGTEMKRRLLELEGWRVEGSGFNSRLVSHRHRS